MDEKILDFAQLLRQNGIQISTPEVMDALRALECIPFSDRTIFQQALCSSLIKEAGQIKTFNYLFESYFFGLPRLLASQNDKNPLQVSDPGQFQELLDRLREILKELELKLSPLAEALVFRDVGRLTLLIQEAARPLLEADFEHLHQSYQFAFQTMARMNFGSVQKEILELIKQIEARLAENPGEEPLPEYLQNLLKEFPQLLKDFFLQEYQKQAYALRKGIRQDRIYQMNFFTSTPADIQNMSEVARELAEKLKTASSLRREIKSRGRLQVRATLRKNLQNGGIPFRLVFDKKKIVKPQIVILTDISNSMRNASRFMLTLVYSLQELYSRVRSFLFVSDIGEATSLFQQYEIGEAL
ncbi:MAG: VWA domain-containing protein, partial [Deltaproteobacteria bacterium]|nr:VWA domain-containing protein [Deltaproteobacteria bacterium]